MAPGIGTATKRASPVGSVLIGVLTILALSALGYLAFGLVVLVSAGTAALSYFQPKVSGLFLAATMSLPIYWLFMGNAAQDAQSLQLSELSLILLAVTLIAVYSDWLAGIVGLDLGFLLALGSLAVALVIPILAFFSLRRGWRSGVVCLVTFSLFGVFYLVSMQIGFLVPFSTYTLFFPSFATLVGTQPFSSLATGIFGSGAGSSSNPTAPVFDYLPIYFALVGSLVIILGTEGKKLLSRFTFDSPIGDAAILAAVSGFGSWLVFGSTATTLGAALVVASLTLGYRLLVPVLAAKPRTPDIATVTALFPTSAAKLAVEFDEKEGIITESNPGKSKMMRDYWERTKGVAEVKEELTKAVALPIKHKKEASKFGVKASHGVLLYGPPGTGKTTLLRGLASMLEMRYVEVNPAQILSKWYGESERKTKEVFDEAELNPPCILALDEVESVGKKRDSYAADDVTPKVLNIVLMEMDRISREDIDVVVVGTTNKPDALDRALLRPGRFDKVIYMGPPDERAREEIFRWYISGKEVVAKDVDFAKLAKLSERFTGADIEGLVNKVLAGAFYDKLKSQQEGTPVTQEMFESAIKTTQASIDSATLEEYERFRVEFQRERRIRKGWESEISDVRFEDIGDMEAEKQELREIFELPIQRPELFEELKMRPVKGVLLHGPPGCGKTLLAKALATEISANFFVVSGGEIARKGAANAATQIKDLFNLAKDNSPAIVFIDEIDQIAPDRSNPMGALYTPVTTQLLTELDGVKELKGVWVLAATNRPEVLDPALLRANRLEKHIEIPLPDEKARMAILGVCLKDVKVGEGVSVEDIAKKTGGFNGADLQELVNEAKKRVLRRVVSGDASPHVVGKQDFDDALQEKTKSRDSLKGPGGPR